MNTLILFVWFALATPTFLQKESSALQYYELHKKPTWHAPLHSVLKEISGLACTTDGRVFAHNDEFGNIYHIDAHTGEVLASFSIGSHTIRDDFEGLCIVGDEFYLSTSKGDIYAFHEGDNGTRVPYTVYRTRLGKQYEVEGLCYDPLTHALLLPVKHSKKKKKRDGRPVFSFALFTKTLDRTPRFVLQDSDIDNTPNGEFNPSSIEYNPATGTFFLLAAQGHAVLELSASGAILRQSALDNKLFPQPEGIAFTLDGTLLLCSEASDTQPAIIAGFRPIRTIKKQ